MPRRQLSKPYRYGKFVQHMIAGYDVALMDKLADLWKLKGVERFSYMGREFRYADPNGYWKSRIWHPYRDYRFDIYDLYNQLSDHPTWKAEQIKQIIINRHQAELNGLFGGSSFAMVGGIGAFLVGTVFLVAAGLHWGFCARHPAALPVRRQSVRLTFARPEPVTAIALLST